MENKKVLILNGTISEIPIIRKSQAMGYYTVTTGNMPELPGHLISNEYIKADYSDYNEVLNIVKKNNISGIISCANDFGVITSSYVAETMNWRGHDTFDNSLLIHRKDRFMEYFKKNSIPTPWFEIFDKEESAFECLKNCRFPIMVKANDLTGGKGICKASSKEEAAEAIKNAFKISRDRHILLESFIDGIEQSIVVFLVNKKIKIVSCSDIFCWRNPYLVQAETYPASDFEKVKKQLYDIIYFMAEDLNLVDGILSFQYIVKNNTPYIIDMMRRCFGNETLLLADEMTGFPWEEAYIKSSLGLPCDNIEMNKISTKFCGHFGIMAEKNGILKDYSIPEDINNRLFKKTELIKEGQIIKNYLNDKIALLYYKYDNFLQMKREVAEYNNRIAINME